MIIYDHPLKKESSCSGRYNIMNYFYQMKATRHKIIIL